MEWWNVEFNKEFISMLTFLTSLSKEILPVTHFSISPKPIIPSFQLRSEAELCSSMVVIDRKPGIAVDEA